MVLTLTRNPNLTKERQKKEFGPELKAQFGVSWWTGLSPQNCPGFDAQTQTMHAIPFLNLSACTRQDVIDYFNNSWTLTELLFQGLKVEEAYVRPPYHQLRHPMIFYYGHPAVLYLNKLRVAGLLHNAVNPYLEKVLETGVDEMSWDDMSKNEMEWPSVACVHAYRKQVYNIVLRLLQTHPDLDFVGERRVWQDSPWWALWMGMEHEKIHFETSSVLIRELPIEYLEEPEFWPRLVVPEQSAERIENLWQPALGGEVILGKPMRDPTYGWDNEYGKRTVFLKDFEYTQYQITNGEYYDFVKSGAYVNDAYWRHEGREWRKFRNTKRPTFWVSAGPEGGHEYELRTIFEIVSMPWNCPVEVNFHEAVAYCNWKKERDATLRPVNFDYRLLSEAEFVKVSRDESLVRALSIANVNFVRGAPCDVTMSRFAGNVWHWLEDEFNPLPGFQVHPYYDDFSTPCFDGKHQMIAGGSFMSCGNEAGMHSRFHFRPHFYQHSGFRMARTTDGSSLNGATFLSERGEYVHPKRENVLQQMQKDEWWKNVQQPLELSEFEIRDVLERTSHSIQEFMRGYGSMHPMGTALDPLTQNLKTSFSVPYQQSKTFPAHEESFEGLLKLVFNELTPLSQLPGHPGYAAYVAGAGNLLSGLASLIGNTLNTYTAHTSMAPGLVALEHEVLKWFVQMVGYNTSVARGYLTTGASQASLNALMIARKEKIQGFDYSRVTGYVSAETHHSIAKAWVLLGFDKSNLRVVESSEFTMNTAALRARVRQDKNEGFVPFFVVGNAGSTRTGSVDNLRELADVAESEELWLHVDAAYGGFFMLTSKGKALLTGIERAHSVVLDPHKSLSIPYGTGCLLVRDGKTLHFNYQAESSYMPPLNNGEYDDFATITPELSRDFRGIRLWIPIKTFGISPFILNLEEKLSLAKWFASELQKLPQIEVLTMPRLSIFTFAHKEGDAETRKLLARINAKGTLYLSGCELNGRFAIRVCLLGFRMHFQRLQQALQEMEDPRGVKQE
jgi:5-histidylcysteine sulfoxide synthase